MKVCKEILRDVLTAFILWEIRRTEGHSTKTVMEKTLGKVILVSFH